MLNSKLDKSDIDNHWNTCASQILGHKECARPKGWRYAEGTTGSLGKMRDRYDVRNFYKKKTNIAKVLYRCMSVMIKVATVFSEVGYFYANNEEEQNHGFK